MDTEHEEAAPVEAIEPVERRSRRARLLRIGAIAILVWLGISYFAIRPLAASRLEKYLAGRCRVSFALLWPTLDITAFGAVVEGENFRLAAPRLHADVSFRGLFTGGPVHTIDVHELVATLQAGESVKILRDSGSSGGSGEASHEIEEYRRLPPLLFHDSRVDFSDGAGNEWNAFRTSRLVLSQLGDRLYSLASDAGTAATIPFEKATAQMVRQGGHLLFQGVKMRCFNGMAGGSLDVHMASHAGAFNGEIEWHFVEVEEIWRTYGLKYAEKRRGDLRGRVSFGAERPSLASLQGTAEVELFGGDFYSPISFKVTMLLDIPKVRESELTEARMKFTFRKGFVHLQEMRAAGRQIKDLHAQGVVSYRGDLDMEVTHGNMTIAVRGDVEAPTVKALPFNSITVPFDRLFRERIGEKD